ncbi:SUMO-activating enzyme subunit 2 [Myzus persicae]|uniref:SUMO-activating enzyme subunit 2 n=1 Tax=Myzus persicae TaxID=13164 RepID=UPI000B9314CD|nr:SUMO-activating enzyme subunit 2 [Myzus persicae]
MAATIAGVFHPELQNLIKESKVLLVGAGGIGCEVLKNLVLTGFGELEVIDLDTIEVSNLNRQFLFSKESVGKAKSHVAKDSVLKFNPNVNITSHLGDIMDTKYGVAFFNKFQLVINALDNKKARSHVNRMCLSCQIPLIESGTMGYNGQVEFIKKGVSMCYECNPRSEPKTYPMCTIRNTPKEPIHCIVWAKFLFSQLFGESDEDVSMEEADQDGSEKLSAHNWAVRNKFDPKKLFKKIFFDDINYLLKMPDLYAEKKIKPVLLDESLLDQEHVEYSHVLDSDMLTLQQCVSMFIDSVTDIKEKWEKSENLSLIWDKDEDSFMNFVVSCSNIRSAIFNIPFKTHFDIKSMAGNIIPAIATANAIIAGQIVIHALRILRGNYERCQSVFLRNMPNHKGGVLVKDNQLQPPNPKCAVCSSEGEIILMTDVDNFTVRQLEDLVLMKKLNMVAPDVTIFDRVIISSDEEDDVDLYHKSLAEVGLIDGSSFVADDVFQNFSIKIRIYHEEKSDEEQPDFQVFSTMNDLLTANEIKKEEESENDEDDCVMQKDVSSVGKSECDNNEDTGDSNHVLVSEENISNEEEGEEELAYEGEEEMASEEGGEEMACEEEIAYEEGAVEIDHEEVSDDEISNEEILAIKRKADDAVEDSDPKKSRTD